MLQQDVCLSDAGIVAKRLNVRRQTFSSSDSTLYRFLPARRYASAGYRDRNVSVRLSVCLSVRASVCHAPVLCQNEES